MNLICIIGEPASGKTTLFRELMVQTGPLRWYQKKRGLVVCHQHSKSKAVILGDYSQEGTFGGTDRLSMAVQKPALDFVKELSLSGDCPAIMLEGDRLGNNSFLDAVESFHGVRLTVIELFASPETLKARHSERGDTQTEKWLTGRLTKLANIRRARPVERRPNSNREQLLANAEYILERAGLLVPAGPKT